MRFGTLLGWGIVIYAIMSLASSLFVVYGIAGTFIARLLGLLVLILVLTIAGRSLRRQHWIDVLPYSIGWAILAALLDAVYVVPFGGWAMYGDWNLWVGYVLVVIVPLIAPFTRALPEPQHLS